MNYRMIVYILSNVLLFEGAFLLLPAAVAGVYGESQGVAYLITALVCVIAGILGRCQKPEKRYFYAKEGYVSVSLSWILLGVVGAVPFYATGEIPLYIDALFEAISGLTTTGGSILSSVEGLSRCSAFWRCFTHWIGGMGILVFIMAVLPLSGGSTMHLMRAESPGPSVGKLVPKVKRTAMILYGIYIVITLIVIIALKIAGLPLYDSMVLSFGTVGTGGFGILDTSIASYSLAVQVIITIFMLVCSINFNVYYLILIKKVKEAVSYEELKYFLVIVFGAAVLITCNIRGSFTSIPQAFHTAFFQVASVISTTGFSTQDYNRWPEFSKSVLVLLMVIGACAGSTGGGFKVSRIMILLRAVRNEIIAITHPRSVQKVHMNGHFVPDHVVKTVLCYLAAYVIIILGSFFLVSLDKFDTATDFSAVVAMVNNVGPGLHEVGPYGNFGGYNPFSKLVLIFDMLAGRLELFPVLILFSAGTWRRPAVDRKANSR